MSELIQYNDQIFQATKLCGLTKKNISISPLTQIS